MNLTNKVALVTGSAKRVGRAIALALADRGVNLIVHYHSSARDARQTVTELKRRGVDAIAVKADQSNAAQVKAAVGQALRHFQRIDILINSAAIYQRTPFVKLTERHWDQHLDSNLKGPFLFALEVGKHLKKRRAAGKIINIADWSAYRPYSDYLPYCVSKAGLICLTQALAKELAPRIQVNAVAPGPVLMPPQMTVSERDAIRNSTVLKRLGRPQDVVDAVLYLLESGDFVTGHTLVVDGGRLIRGSGM